MFQRILVFCRQNPVVVWVAAYALLAAILVVIALVSTF
jgi:hypothetical protein